MNVERIFSIHSEKSFYSLALEIFSYQYNNVPVYRQYCDLRHRNPDNVKHILDIPFLPIQFFRHHEINSGTAYDVVFESSGTNEENTSKHFVADKTIYEMSFTKSFQHFYHTASNYVWLCLLPSYLERKNSSLVYMTDFFIRHSTHSESHFYLHQLEQLYQTLIHCIEQKKPTILMGVSFALLDFASTYSLPEWSDIIVMETGGMKGNRKEIVRSELHQTLKNAFRVNSIHSEYGMTELLSQAYSKGEGIFNSPPWMKVFIRDIYDPYNVGIVNKSGGINCIDLANIYSCSFIETQDMGIVHNNGSFEVLGRIDQSITRGCNTLL